MSENKVEIPMSREAVLDWIGHAMRNRAFPEFHAAPLPLWATDAAENILRFFEQYGRVVAVDPKPSSLEVDWSKVELVEDWCNDDTHTHAPGECPNKIDH